MKTRVKVIVLLVLASVLLVGAASVALAQDEGDETGNTSASVEAEGEAAVEEGDSAPSGIGTLILLLGLSAVLVVGGLNVAKENFNVPLLQRDTETNK